MTQRQWGMDLSVGEEHINKHPLGVWGTSRPHSGPRWLSHMLPAAPGVGPRSGPGRRAPTHPTPAIAWSAQLQVAGGGSLGPTCPLGRDRPQECLQGPRGSAWPALPHLCHRLWSQCWGLGFKPQAATRTCFRRKLWVDGVSRSGGLWHRPLCYACGMAPTGVPQQGPATHPARRAPSPAPPPASSALLAPPTDLG